MDLLNYYDAVRKNFEEIKTLSGDLREYRFKIAGRFLVSIKFTSKHLASELTKSFSHLSCSSSAKPDLTILAWDSSMDRNRPAPYPFWNNSRGMLYRDFLSSDRVMVACDLEPNRLSLLDIKADTALYWIDDADRMPYYEKGSPFRFILHWWLSGKRCQFIHAAAVGKKDGGVLLGGAGGSGKSTAALACLDSDLLYAGDDYCLVDLQDGLRVHSIYNTAKLKGAEDLKRFPKLADAVVNPRRTSGEKAIMFLGDIYREKMIKDFPLKAILIPQYTGREDTVMRKAANEEALRAIFPSTAIQARGYGVSDFYSVFRLVKQTPSYVLETGADLEKIAGTISKFLSEA